MSSKIPRFPAFSQAGGLRLKLRVVVRDRIELSTFRFSGEPERYLDVACYGLTRPSAGITVALGRSTSHDGWQRWLPEWLPEPTSPGVAWLCKCSLAATIDPGRVNLASLAPGRKPKHADEQCTAGMLN
jgi:hypothetical protein